VIFPSEGLIFGAAVKDLLEPEFDLLFVDNARDDYFPRMVTGELEGSVRLHSMTALSLLEGMAVQ
jgi:hypothetical protein